MITEDFCSFDVAQLLKEKGFDELCIFKYNSEGVRMKSGSAIDEWQNSELDDDECSCVSHQMAMKWLREVYKLSIEPYSIAIEENCIGYAYAICSCKTGLEIFAERWDGKNPFVSYEEAIEAALKYALENLL